MHSNSSSSLYWSEFENLGGIFQFYDCDRLNSQACGWHESQSSAHLKGEGAGKCEKLFREKEFVHTGNNWLLLKSAAQLN